MRKMNRILSMVLVLCMLLSIMPMGTFAVDITEKPANGTTVGQPFPVGAGGSTNFRIPGFVTLDNGTLIAQALGVPESVIALTFVALGTSLPELVTAITSLAKGHGALSLGNIIGANLFNLVLVSGLSVVLSPFAVPASKLVAGMNASLAVDIPLMFFVMAFMTLPAVFRGKLQRWQGVTLLGVYAAYIGFQFFG